MDDQRFEQLTRALADRATRRGMLGILAGLAGLWLSGAKAKRGKQGRQTRGGGSGRLGAEAKPGREVISVDDDFTSDSCGFAVDIQVRGEYIVHDHGDRYKETWGGVKWTLTNPDNGASTRINANGPLFIKYNEDGSYTFSGSGPWAWDQEHPETGEPGIWLTKGRFVWLFDADDNFVSSLKFTGKSEYLCDALD